MLTISSKYRRTLTQLDGIDIPTREGVSARWKGIRHSDLAHIVLEACAEHNLTVTNADWGVNKQQTDLFGSLDLSPSDDMNIVTPSGTGLSLAVRHSNVGEYAVTFAVGARVFVCANGMLYGDFVVSHKHTISLVLCDLVDLAMRRFIGESRKLAAAIAALQSLPMTDAHAARAIMDATFYDEMPERFALAIWKQWKTPAHADFLPRTGWSLHNAFTEVAKSMAPATQYTLLRALPRRITLAASERDEWTIDAGQLIFDGEVQEGESDED